MSYKLPSINKNLQILRTNNSKKIYQLELIILHLKLYQITPHQLQVQGQYISFSW